MNGIPVGATLNAATLKVNVSTNKTLTTSEIHRHGHGLDRGDEQQHQRRHLERFRRTPAPATGRPGPSAPATTTPPTVGTITPSTKGVKTADVKSLVLGWQTGAFANNGLVLLTTGTATGDAAYASRENGTAANRPVINVNWSIPPANPTRVNTMSAGPLLVVEGDKITVKMVLAEHHRLGRDERDPQRPDRHRLGRRRL